jgi:hypothetical protein
MTTLINVKYYGNMHEIMRLTEEQRYKLMHRNNLSKEFDVRKRRENEFTLRNHLKSFLEFIQDANSILYNLPKDQLAKNERLKDVLKDDTVYQLFNLLFQLLNVLDFGQASGRPQKPIVVVDEYEMPLTCRYAPPMHYDEPFDLAREQAKIDHSSRDVKPPIVKKMTYEEMHKIRTINLYIQELVSHYQSDPVLLAKIIQLWRDDAREGKKTNLEPSVKDRMIAAMEKDGIAPEEYKQHMK